MPDVRSLRTQIFSLFERGSICLWFSGGSDSLLLLHVLLEAKRPFGILRFEDGWNKEQRAAVDAVIIANNLQVFSYPARSHVLCDEGEMAMVSQYAIDGFGNTAMLGRDLVDDPKRCAFDIKIETAKQPTAPVEFDLHIWGTRGDDKHWIFGEEPILHGESGWKVGDKDFIAPLAEFSRQEVIHGLREYGVVYKKPSENEDTGNVAACTRCLRSSETGKVLCPKSGEVIPTVEWDGAANTLAVRSLLNSR